MSTWQLFKSSFFEFANLITARKIAFWKAILYVLFLSGITAIPITIQSFTLFNDLHADNVEIAERIPDFRITDGEIITDKKNPGFIYQTDHIIFTFDPEGKRSTNSITSDLVGNLFSIGFTKDRAVLSIANGEQVAAILGTSTFELPYTNNFFAGFDSTKLKSMLQENIVWWAKVLVFLVFLYSSAIELIFTLLLTSLGGIIFMKLRKLPMTYFEILKIMTYSATLPTILATVILLFPISFDISAFTTLATLFIFFQAVKAQSVGPEA